MCLLGSLRTVSSINVMKVAASCCVCAMHICREGMRKGGVRLQEPIMKVEVVTPEDHMGDVIGDLNARRGTVTEFLDKPGNLRLIRAFVPLSEMFSYISNLRGAFFTFIMTGLTIRH